MKADMVALKDQVAFMMEAMLSMKRLIESNTATATAASATAEADPTHPSATNQAHQPTSDMMGQGREVLGSTDGPHMGYNRNAYPYSLPPNYTSPTMHKNIDHAILVTLEGQQPQPMVEGEMIIMIVDTLSVFYYENLVAYMPSSFVDLVFVGERIKVGLKRGKFDYIAPAGTSNRRF